MSVLVTAKENINKKNDVKARSLLLMALPNEHQLTSSQYNDAKTILQKIVNRLEILGVVITQDDLNSKFLRSLHPKWNTHVVVWMNKAGIKTMSINDLYNNFKIFEQDVKKTVGTSTSAQNMAFMTAPSTSSTNDVNTANPAYESSNVSPNVNTTILKGLATVEEQLVTYKKNEVLFNEEFAVLKREVACKDNKINVLKREFEKVKKEKEGIEFKIKKFDNASKSLDKLIGSQITDNKPEFKGYGPRDSKQTSNTIHDQKSDDSKENSDDSFVKEQVSEDTNSFVESPLNVDKETAFSVDKKIEFVKPKNHDKPVKKSIRKRRVFGNNYNRVDYNYYAKTTHPGAQGNMTPRAVLLKTGLKQLNTVYNSYSKPTGKPQNDDKGFIDSGCSRHMTGNIAYLSDFKEFDGGYVTFGGGAHGGRIFGKGTLKTDSLDFKNVYFVNKLKFNIFSVSQMCDKKNYVLFTKTECLILSSNFKLPDETQILLKIPRNDNMYSFDIKNIVTKESLACLVAKATLDESLLWHRRLGHINFKNINKLVQANLVRGLPIKRFENDKTCVVCLKGKQHKASCKSMVLNPITNPLFMLHMDLFGATFMSSLMHKKYCLVIADDYSRCDNETEFKNKVIDDFCREKGIKRKYSVARTPQQIGVVERRNRTLIKAARTMLADSNVARTPQQIGVVERRNRTLIEAARTMLADSNKIFRVYNTRTRKVEENLHIGLLENKPMIEGNDESAGPQGDLNADKSEDDSSPKEVNVARQHVNTASLEVNTGRFELNNVEPLLSTASLSDPHSPTDMFKLGASDTLEATHVEFYSDRDVPEVDLGNIHNSYKVPTTSHTRIHKDHPIKNVIDVKSASTPVDLEKPSVKDGDANDVDVHLYRSMIGFLMYLTASRPDIMFAETASASTLQDGDIVITATIDGRIKTITKASIRRHLKLEDSEGISSLPNTKIFKQLALIGKTTHDAEESATMTHDSPLPIVQSLGSVEGSLTLNELT
nr:putative ribonuclease H-like domain-containing protein [Tanacetum cinerariifolium]